MTDAEDRRMRYLREKSARLGPMLDGCLQTKRNRVVNKDGGYHTSPEHYQFQYRGSNGKPRWKSVPRKHCAEVRRLIARGSEYRSIEREYAALMTEITLADILKND